jgi:hypothetical protein
MSFGPNGPNWFESCGDAVYGAPEYRRARGDKACKSVGARTH